MFCLFIANGNTIINEETLEGPNSPIRVDYDFGFNGFNYVTLFAHNLGDMAPNTCTIAINGVEFILEANLEANGSIDVIVGGFGVDCTDAGGGTGGDPTDGDVKFFTSEDFGCGPITVNVNGVGSSSITSFFDSGAPDCSNPSAGGNFNDLAPGTYSFTASCVDRTWESDFTVIAGGCLRFQLQ